MRLFDMNLSNTAKEVVINHFLSDHHYDEAHKAFDSIMEDPEVLDECIVWKPFTPYNYQKLAELMSDHAEAVQEAIAKALAAQAKQGNNHE